MQCIYNFQLDTVQQYNNDQDWRGTCPHGGHHSGWARVINYEACIIIIQCHWWTVATSLEKRSNLANSTH